MARRIFRTLMILLQAAGGRCTKEEEPRKGEEGQQRPCAHPQELQGRQEHQQQAASWGLPHPPSLGHPVLSLPTALATSTLLSTSHALNYFILMTVLVSPE